MFKQGLGNWTDYRWQFSLEAEDEIDLHFGKRERSSMSMKRQWHKLQSL